VNIVESDVLDAGALRAAMQGQDAVYANLAGDMARQARAIIDAIYAVGLKRWASTAKSPGRRIEASWTRIGTRRPRSRNRT
jgi:uncharacterized protein YbjT (DUF2867 family)